MPLYNSSASATPVIGKQSLFVPAGAILPTRTDGCDALSQVELTTGRPDLRGLVFPEAGARYAQFEVSMPKAWNRGAITARFHWLVPTAGTGVVRWTIQGVCLANGAALNTAYGALTSITQASAGPNAVNITPITGAIAMSGTEPGLSIFRIARTPTDVADTLTQNVTLLGVMLIYTTTTATDD